MLKSASQPASLKLQSQTSSGCMPLTNHSVGRYSSALADTPQPATVQATSPPLEQRQEAGQS
ncbi:hypothetical protein E2C01_087500 [Portunus trituberculatus]|uniref:Uncharacterized protein n=1 Tax=Portunus trituberculatus TaxID=210409 RepID=A0A5B7J893_PORTR|nr:hypothetical protein [Portunus trituberculatus]